MIIWYGFRICTYISRYIGTYLFIRYIVHRSKVGGLEIYPYVPRYIGVVKNTWVGTYN